MMKSENFYGFRTQTTNWIIFLSRWSWSDECYFFLDRVFLTECLRVRTHVAATTVCTTVGVRYTHLLHAHFSAHSSCSQICTSSCVSHTRMAQGHEKGLLHVHVVDLHLAFSSLMSHPSLLFLDGHFETIPDFDVHTFFPNLPVLQAQDIRNSAQARRSLAIWPSPPSTHKVVNVYLCLLTCLPFSTCCNHRCGLLDFRRVSSSDELKSFFYSVCASRCSGIYLEFSLLWLLRRGCGHHPCFGGGEERGLVLCFELKDIFRQTPCISAGASFLLQSFLKCPPQILTHADCVLEVHTFE